MKTIIENLNWRYATKVFDTSKELPAEDLEYILEAGRLAATSYGLQPFKMVVVTDEAKKQELMGHAYGQGQVGVNGALIILAAQTNVDEAFITEFTTRIEATRGLPIGAVSGYKDTMVSSLTADTSENRLIWAQKQTYIALGTMMVAAAEKMVDGCPMEGFSVEGFDEVLGLKAHNLTASVIFPVGFRAESDATQHYAKVRRPAEDMIILM